MLRWFCRFRYPVTLPEEVGFSLGVKLSNWYSVKSVLRTLTAPGLSLPHLCRNMERSAAEAVFANALKKERFGSTSLFSYLLAGDWLEFSLHFDSSGSRLRRIYLLHRLIPEEQGAELALR